MEEGIQPVRVLPSAPLCVCAVPARREVLLVRALFTSDMLTDMRHRASVPRRVYSPMLSRLRCVVRPWWSRYRLRPAEPDADQTAAVCGRLQSRGAGAGQARVEGLRHTHQTVRSGLCAFAVPHESRHDTVSHDQQ